ncbi:MAG: Na+/H+ antiporter subunit C [Alphaproteobacteria bacterium]|jgi:multicomponent Na+:H+ antiporter subunit C|nr:Na+/H+ antiporter subunit C [Alphaproteobacteria bacterium]
MELALAVLVGVLTTCAVYLMLSGNMVRFIFALALLSNAVNLVIFAAGRLTYAAPPLIADGAKAPADTVANALPQALILTAIVIGFGLLAFTLVLVHRAHQTLGTVEADDMRVAEPASDDDEAR